MASVKMHRISARRIRRVRAKSQSGQSLIIALSILLLIGFLGALFSAIVVRNLTGAQNSNETINVDYFAKAGINYANAMLETSQQGADWRPPLQFVDTTNGYLYTGGAPSAASTTLGLNLAPAQDPDFQWLNVGYTRYNVSGGRFLLKITYDPNVSATASPTAKYIEIDAIGRMGNVDSNDPTTYTQTPPDLRREHLVAYKPIGITDYSRFITNKDYRTDTANLGVPSISIPTTTGPPGTTAEAVTPGVYDIDPTNLPNTNGNWAPAEYPIITSYGSAASLIPTTATGTAPPGGGSLRSNMNLRLYGINDVYLNPSYGDDWEVAGNLTFDGYSALTANNNSPTAAATYSGLPAQFNVTSQTTSGISINELFPSNDANFSTDGGIIRDGNTGNDSYGDPRQIRRLNPPLIDTIDSVTGLTRYQELTASSEIHTQQYASTSDYAPATININNDSDIQHESLNAIGGSTLRDDWLNPGTANTGGSWEGNFYNPPGALITFGKINGVSGNPYGITITRSDTDSSGTAVQWYSPANPNSEIGQTLFLSYDALPGTNPPNPSTSAVGYLDVNQPKSSGIPNDIVIHASGNVRIRGIISDPNPNGTSTPKHITIVTDGIAYIDGSILKGNQNSSIAILAKQYVCLNTTQFLAGAPDYSTSVNTPTSVPGTPPSLSFANSETLSESSLYAPQSGPIYSGINLDTTPYLYISQSAGGTSESSQGDLSIVDTSTGLPTGYGLLSVTSSSGNVPTRSITLLGTTAYTDNYPFILSFSKSAQAEGDWLLQKAAVLPGDIHIEAVLYAQDDSFFVIPGDWFNTDSSDTLSNAPTRTNSNTNTLDPRFPFYGQPIDLQVSILGAVSENIPANISDQASWMQKWGWIPRYHGSDTGSVSPHAYNIPTNGTNAGINEVGIGLNFTYDYEAGFPFTGIGTTFAYLRQDRYGRPLAFAPSLPVSPDLLYYGQAQN